MSSVEVYSVADRSWLPDLLPPLNLAREGPGVAALRDPEGRNKIFVVGGKGAGEEGALEAIIEL